MKSLNKIKIKLFKFIFEVQEGGENVHNLSGPQPLVLGVHNCYYQILTIVKMLKTKILCLLLCICVELKTITNK